MSRESGPERTQRTVAELLAQHGASNSSSGARRRRRRADDADESAPKTIIERVLSDSGRLPQVSDDDPSQPEQPVPPAPEYPPAQQRPAARRQASPREVTPPALPARDDSFVSRQDDSFLPRHDDPAPTELLPPTDPLPRRHGAGGGHSGYLEPPSAGLPTARPAVPLPPAGVADAEVTAQYAPITENTPPPTPTVGGRSVRLPRPLPAREPLTEQIPRITEGLDPNLTTEIPAISALPPGHGSGGPETESWFHQDGFVGEGHEENGSPAAYGDQGYQDEYYEDDSYADGEYDQDEFADEVAEHGHITEDEAAAGTADEDLLDEEYDEEETKRSPAKEWLVMVTQLGAGVIGGGGIWLGFQYLWRAMPAVALGVAVVITVGLVWMVRRIRRADDLQTIVLAVLVGLVVTVSPAALLLVGR